MGKNSKKFILALSILLAASLTLAGCSKNDDNQGESSSNDNQEQNENGFVGTLEELINKGESYQCSASYDVDGVSISTAYYIDAKNEKSRTDTTSTMNGNPVITHTIINTDASYTWQEGASQGTKITFDEVDESEAEDLAEGNEDDYDNEPLLAADNYLEDDLNFECDKWRVDESMFELPSGVEFRDLSDLTNQFMGQTGNMEDIEQNMEEMMQSMGIDSY